MAKPAAPRDGVAVVIPVHNAAAALERMLSAWGAVLSNLNRPFEILVVNDASTDATAATLDKLAARVPRLRVLTHEARRGFGACLRTALAEVKQPLVLYCGADYPYTPTDIKPMLERVELRDEVLGKQPDLISGFRAGQPRPTLVIALSWAWKLFWRFFAGLPIAETPPWYSWGEWWYKTRVGWVFGVPLVDVNSAFKLYRTAFLKRFPIQSDGDFVHTELVAKATFLTSIMDEIPLTEPPNRDLVPPLGPVADDRRTVFRDPQFTHEEQTPAAAPPKVDPKSPEPVASPTPDAPKSATIATSATPSPPSTQGEPAAVAAPAAAPTATPTAPTRPSPDTHKPTETGASIVPSPSPKPAEPATASTPPASTEPAQSAKTAVPIPPIKGGSVPEPVTPTDPGTKAAANTESGPTLPAVAPASEATKPTEPVAPTPSQPVTPEPAHPQPADAPKPAAPTSSGAKAEADAGGLASPGSPVPAS